jgi:hypothetical protein
MDNICTKTVVELRLQMCARPIPGASEHVRLLGDGVRMDRSCSIHACIVLNEASIPLCM